MAVAVPSDYRLPMRRAMLWSALGLAAAFIASGCDRDGDSTGRQGCETDGECERAERCVASACVPPEAIALCEAECPRTGGCTPRVRVCVAEHESCNLGLRKVECLATNAEHCQRSALCQKEGRCTVADGQCVRSPPPR